MPSMPIDVNKVFEAIKNIGNMRDIPTRVMLVFDPTASDSLVDCILEAFVETASNARVTDAVLGNKLPKIPKDADLVVIVGGESLLLGDVAHAAKELGIPAVVVVERGKTYFANDKRAAQAYADMTLEANTAPSLTGNAKVPGVGRGIELENLVDIDLDEQADRPLEQLGAWIVSNVTDKRLSLAHAFAFLRHPLAIELSKQTVIQNGAIGLVVFIPMADMPLIALNQAKLVLQVAAVYGRPMDKERIGEVVAVVAGGLGFRTVARKLVAHVPVLGWAIKPAVAASGTAAMAVAAIEYYEEDGKLHGISELVDKAMKKAKPVIDKGTKVVGDAIGGATARL